MILTVAKWILIMVGVTFIVACAVVAVGIIKAIIDYFRERKRQRHE